MRKILMRYIALCIAFVLVMSNGLVIAEEQLEAYILYELGLLSNISDNELEMELNRLVGIVMVLKSLGYTDTDADALADNCQYIDMENEYEWGKGWVTLAKTIGITEGITETEFGPGMPMTPKQFATFELRALGYGSIESWEQCEELALNKKMINNFNALQGDTLTKEEATVLMYNTLLATMEDGGQRRVIENLILQGEVNVKVATEQGLINPSSLEVISAKGVNGNVIEIEINESQESIDLSNLTVLDSAGNILTIESIKTAIWDKQNKTFLLIMKDELRKGYTYKVVTSISETEFKGATVNTQAPLIDEIHGKTETQILIAFDEYIDIEQLDITVNEAYGSKKELTQKDITYDDTGSEIIFSTEKLVNGMKYEININNVMDFRGNSGSLEEEYTFEKDDTKLQTVESISVVGPQEIVVTFGLEVDRTTALDVDNYLIKEKYDDKNEIDVVSAKINTDSRNHEIETEVRLYLETYSKVAVLYEIFVEGVQSSEETDLDDDYDSETFVGIVQDELKNVITGHSVDVISDTKIEIEFTMTNELNSDSITAEMISINEKYGNKTSLEFSIYEIKERSIVLKTELQKDATLYEITIDEGIEDYAGNMTDETIEDTFVGTSNEED